MQGDAKSTIVIKKIKKHAHGHHGGAWKVAYADFVTAMMAFFMLLWLMNIATPQQKQSISGFFDNPSAVPGGTAGSATIIDLGGSAPEMPKGKGDNPLEMNQIIDASDVEQLAEQIEHKRLESLLQELNEAIEQGQALKPFKDQLLLDITNEGLRIQIVDKENRPMFDLGSERLKDYTRDILHEIVKIINDVPNKIGISGHTDQTPYSSEKGYSNWELSAGRANSARRELIIGGMSEEKIGRVVGLASSVLFDKEDPYNPINRRISIIVMNKAAEKAVRDGEGKNQSDKQHAPAAHKKPTKSETPSELKREKHIDTESDQPTLKAKKVSDVSHNGTLNKQQHTETKTKPTTIDKTKKTSKEQQEKFLLPHEIQDQLKGSGTEPKTKTQKVAPKESAASSKPKKEDAGE